MTLTRRTFFALPALAQPAAALPPIPEPHFPSTLYLFVWRNWEIANIDRMAVVLKTTPANVLAIGRQMGLPEKPRLTDDQLRRIYITVIRQNWHLLPEDQLMQLLGWDREKFDFTLKEDDFLDHKLGNYKPSCPPVLYHPPTAEERARAGRIAATFATLPRLKGQPLFHFIEQFNKPVPQSKEPERSALWSPRFLYSYHALYGDPLLDPSSDPFPDGLLQQLAQVGINGVWLQGVLNTLAPHKNFPEFGKDSDTRLANLAKLCDRAAKFGVKVLLYMNEPRSMNDAFFNRHPGVRGSSYRELHSMCTSAPQVREWITDSLAHVFARVPNLGGIFTISISENHTNCFSHGGAWRKEAPNAGDCPRCSKRTSHQTLAELFSAMRTGVRRSSKTAEIIHWDWGWPDDMADNLIPLLDKDVKFQSISEWSKPVERGGVKTEVGEYSISVPGPGPRATRNWAIAKKAGLKTMAKTQFNNTWEISAVPFIPVPYLVLEHCAGLRKADVDGIMASWTCGGYPSPNLEAASAYYFEKNPNHDEILTRIATKRFGAANAKHAVEAWRQFSEAFREFPYGVHVYIIPTQHGPANLLRLKPTGHSPGMILNPRDAMKSWCGKYPPEVVQSQFTKLAQKWKAGLAEFEKIGRHDDLAIAQTCYHHFQSVANQVEFYRLRDDTPRNRQRMIELAEAEMDLARRQYVVARGNSTIGYEATNHYYYTPLDLAEKLLNCQQIIETLRG